MNWLLVVCVVLSHNPAHLVLCKVEDLHNTRRDSGMCSRSHQKDLFNCVFVDFNTGVQCTADMMWLYPCCIIVLPPTPINQLLKQNQRKTDHMSLCVPIHSPQWSSKSTKMQDETVYLAKLLSCVIVYNYFI